MNEYKREAIALIESIPDEKSAAVLKILESVCELLKVDSDAERNEILTERVEENVALIEEIENLSGEQVWDYKKFED